MMLAAFTALRNANLVQSYEAAFGAKDITSPAMIRAIQTWNALYFNALCQDDLDSAQATPFTIVDGLCKSAFGEYEYSTDKDVAAGGATELSLAALDGVRTKAFQRAVIGGEAFIKPILRRDRFAYKVIGREDVIVLGRDDEGGITDLVTSALTAQSAATNVTYYRLMERRTVDENGYLTIQSKLYRSADSSILGEEVPLPTLPEYANLQPTMTLSKPLNNVGLIPMRTSVDNCVDDSMDAVSVYAAAVGAILKLYRHEARSQDEYDLTAPHMVASIDVQRRDREGNLIEIPKYITPLLDTAAEDAGLSVWNPKPNQLELEARDDQILRKIENIIGLRRGFLSKSESGAQEMTAKEVESTTTKMAHLVKDLQDMWDSAIKETVRTCGILAGIYGLPWEDAEVVTEFGNGVLYDEQTEWLRLCTLAASGYVKPEILVGWQFDMPTDTAEDLAAIREKYMPEQSEGNDEKGGDPL